MRILQITPYFYPATSLGGTATVVYQLSKYLIAKGHRVTVLTTDLLNAKKRVKYPKNQEIEIDGIRVVYFKNVSNYLAFDHHLFFAPKFFSYLISTISDFDIVHLHEIYTPMHLWAYFLAKRNRIPYLVSSHGTAMSVKEAGRIGRKKMFNFLAGKKLLTGANKLIALTNQEKEDYRKIGIQEDKITVIPNGINIDDFKLLPDRNNSREKFGVKENEILLLFIGRVHPKKGLNLLVKAMNKLRKTNNNIFLIIAGPKENKKYLENIKALIIDLGLEQAVRLMGELNNNGKLVAFSAADLFVLTSYGEGLPVSVLEAAACSLPLLVTEKCGLPEIWEYRAGKVVKVEVGQITAGIQEIVKLKNYRRIYGGNALKMVKEKFSLNSVTDKIIKLYNEVLYEKV